MTISDDNKSFCPAPWLSFYIDPAGNVESCCVSKNDLGNIENGDSVKQIIFHGRNQDIQKSMLAGEQLDGCKWCHGKSHSQQSRYFKLFPDRNDKLYKLGKFELKYLDLRWSNVCNYACVYCGPVFSSTWANELKKTYKIERDTKNELLDYVIENIHTIEELYIAGGEPLMMKENERVLKALVERNPECHVCVNTNLSQIENNRVFQQLKQMKNVQWLISFEASNKQYEYIRYPGVWTEFYDNLKQLRTTVPFGTIAFNMVFISLNALSIWDSIDELLEAGHQPNSITLSLYNNGSYAGPWNIRYLPLDFQQKVLKRMDQPKYQGIGGYQNVQDYLLAGVYTPDVELWNSLDELDQRRKLNSDLIFPEIYQYKQKREMFTN